MLRTSLLLIIALIFINSSAQYTEFQSPLDIPLTLSGNFAELRTDHFHSGLDFKTMGVTGLKVRSIEDAYVSRIKIQTNGYGKSIYLNHPGGYTSVYGHLSDYNDIISEYVKNYQYNNETHTLDLYPGKNEILIKKGEVIAYSGNTGSSSGPHLHFEIRNTANQHPLNGLNYKFNVADTIKPKFYNLYVYSVSGDLNRQRIISRKQINLIKKDETYIIPNKQEIEISSNTGFGLEVFDFLDRANNRCGIYTLELFVNGQALYSFKTDEFSFSESKYINSHIDYELKIDENRQVHRLFKLPNNRLSMVKHIEELGILKFESAKKYFIEIRSTDVAGNETTLSFNIKGGPPSTTIMKEEEAAKSLMSWNKNNEITNHLLKLSIPAGSLYQDAEINYLRISGNTKLCKWIHKVGDPSIALHLGATLKLNISHIDSSFLSKACIVNLDKEGSWDYIGGIVEDDKWIEAKINKFGSFVVDVDTISPSIESVKSDISLKFIVKDNLSGIDIYKGFIDNKWVLFDYDPKNDFLQYVFDADKIKRNSNHELELYVTDKKGNTSLYQNSFYW